MIEATTLASVANQVLAGPNAMEGVEALRSDHEPLLKVMVRRWLYKSSDLRRCIRTSDIAQSVYMRLVKHANKPVQREATTQQSDEKALLWLNTIIRNVIYSRARGLPHATSNRLTAEISQTTRPQLVPSGSDSNMEQADSSPSLASSVPADPAKNSQFTRPRFVSLRSDSNMGLADPAPTPEQRTEANELAEWALKQLSPEQQEFALRQANGEPWKTICSDKVRASMQRLYAEIRELHGKDSEPEAQ